MLNYAKGTSIVALLVLINNYLHDFSAAGWVFGSMLLWSIARKKIPAGKSNTIIVDMLRQTLLMTKISFAGIVVFGVVRAFAYKTYEWNAAAGQSQVTFLIIKHIYYQVFQITL